MRRLLATGIFSLVQAKEAGKHAVLVQGVWGQAAQGLAAEGAPSGIAEPWAGRGGSATLLTFASSWLPRFSCSKCQHVEVMLSQAFFLPRQPHEHQRGSLYPSSKQQGSSAASRSSAHLQPSALDTFLAKERI